ncbi:PKD-like family lipoprotein [Mangrovibacterium lignilyticum]|uniref:PKD-like family lipoprotein n=1 Tax=Mangrovibacterium lignilyticum TaxID=2668052 RepID=UPI0013D74E45|nr:PKD-like family lipoprotein [Mangrovibacterium lignilyticum]
MKKLAIYAVLALLVAAMLTSCYKDDGNYDYSEVPEVKIDTTGVTNVSGYYTVYAGDTIIVSPAVDYPYPENLTYNWLLVDYPYSSEIVGNTTQYPAPDTLATTLDLNWIVDVDPGWYRYYLEVKDTVLGLSQTMMLNINNYLSVQSSSSFFALMCLSEYNGSADIDVYYTRLALIFGGQTQTHFYSQKHGSMIPGKPDLLSYCSGKGYYYAFTDQTGLRLDKNDYLTMENFDEMFYASPNLDPQTYQYQSYQKQELFVNDGKLHALNNNLSNDRKFSAAIAGDYQASSYLSLKGSYSDAGKYLTVIFDEKSKSFLPYYANATSISRFGTSSPDAYVSPNNLPTIPMAIMSYDYTKTCAIVNDGGTIYAYLYNFLSDDDTNFSGNGARSKIDLSGCEDIANAKIFYAGYSGTAFHYATDNAVYAFSITSGESVSHKIYDLPAGEKVTCIYSIPSGGFPTGGRVYWIATWNETQQDGKIVEFELDPNSGLPSWMWGQILGIDQPNPNVTGGFGKITSMRVGI